jgi:hypothetical protein
MPPLADAMDAVRLSVDRFCLLAGVEALAGLCQTNANQVEFVIPGFRWTAQNTCDFQQPLGD